MKRILTLFALLLAPLCMALAQVVTSDPPFPTPNDAVTITFDATQGTGGLANCGCDVYLHTGLITSNSNNSSDWQYVETVWGQENEDWKLTPVSGEPNKYTYTFGPSLIEYYGVTGNETIEQIALVFRNGDGTLEGKGNGNTDIFIEVFPDDAPLSTNLLLPTTFDGDLALGRTLPFVGQSSRAADLTLYDNGEIIATGAETTELAKDLLYLESGPHEIVFRADDGTTVVSDTFQIQAALTVDLLAPETSAVLVAPGAVIPVSATSYVEGQLQLLVNDAVEETVPNAALNTTVSRTEPGAYEVVVRVTYNGETAEDSFVLLVTGDQPAENPPADRDNGITVLSDNSVYLQLYAPEKTAVFVVGNFSDWRLSAEYQMKRAEDGATYWIQLDGLDPAADLLFQYAVDGSVRVGDPLSELVLDANNDPFIGAETFAGIPPYPIGETEGIVSWVRLGEPAYEWQTNDFVPPAPERLTIYELLPRDFIAAHNYQTLLDTLDYIERLGINAIELMPVQEFEGNISWGYNPSYHMALDKYYGSPEAFKAFIDACHARGIAVIVDVVYNHAFSQSALAQMWWDPAEFRPAPNNPYLNVIARHPFNVGYDFNHESQATVDYVDRVMRYWLEEYRIDGFRFDLSKGFTQTFNTDAGAWSQYDASRIEILKHYMDVVWATNDDAYVILEHFAALSEELELAAYGNGPMFWSGAGLHNQYLEGAMGYPSNISDVFYTDRGYAGPDAVNYIESHDEERLMYKTRQFGNSSGDYNVRLIPTGLARSELAHVFFTPVPGPKMYWQFEEIGYDYSINACPDGTVGNCRVDPKPIRWDYFTNSTFRRRLYDVIRALNELRNEYDVFHTDDFAFSLSGMTKRIHLKDAFMDVAIVGNFGVTEGEISNPFPQAGNWWNYFTGEQISVSDPAAALTLGPGEYRLYTTRPLAEPPGGYLTSTREVLTQSFGLEVMPNPSSGQLRLSYGLIEAGQVEIDVLDITGRRVANLFTGRQAADTYQLEADTDLVPGLYLVRVRSGNAVQTVRWVVN